MKPRRFAANAHSFGSPPPIGLVFKLGDQPFTVVEHRPYTRKDGSEGVLILWRAPCADCGAVFDHVLGPSKLPENRRCELHRAPMKRVSK